MVSDWKFFLEKLIHQDASFRNTNIVIVNYDATGVSNQMDDLVKLERETILKSFQKKRILLDYEKFAASYYYVDLIPLLTGSFRYKKIVRFILQILIKLKKYI